MTATASFRRIAIGLMMLSIISGVSLAYATLENGYKLDNNFLTDISESTRTENGYRISIIMNPDIVGIRAEENGYKLDLAVCPQGVGGALEENGYRLDLEPEKLFPAITDESARHDVAIANVTRAKTVVGRGFSLNVSVTAQNNGDFTETFNVTAYANTTTIATFTDITLTSGNLTLTFKWNTAGFAYGNYSISAYASPVEGETHLADNTFVDGWVFVTIPGDINGDQYVNAKDAVILGTAFGSTPSSSNWNANADINNDGIINAKDAVILGTYFGQHWP